MGEVQPAAVAAAPAAAPDKASAAAATAATAAAHLRRLVASCERQQCVDAALYWADKLVSMSASHDGDVYQLATLYQRTGQQRRAVHLLHTSPAFTTSLRFQHLAACCLIECREWEEALAVLGEDDDSMHRRLQLLQNEHDSDSEKGELSLVAAVCFARGRVYEALENWRSSVYWYKEALRHDVRCFDAFHRLVRKQTLTTEEERQLMESLQFPQSLMWLRDMYMCHIEQHDPSSNAIEKRVEALSCVGLNQNLDVLAAQAEHAYYRHEFRRSFDIARTVIDRDPFHDGVLPVYICCLVEMAMKTELFCCAHQLVETYAQKPVAWFAVGSYYYLVGRFDVARRFFSKATSIDSHFAPAWIGFGHSFAAQDESDQAMAAYRAAERIFKGSHIGLLCLGMEFIRACNFGAALTFLKQSSSVCPTDPLVYNELGVAFYMDGEYVKAIEQFRRAIQLVSPSSRTSWEGTFFNLGHAYRKIGNYALSAEQYRIALSMSPKNASVLSALAFTYHLQGNLDEAIGFYHKALSLNSRDSFTSDLLSRALSEMLGTINIHSDYE